MKSAYSRLTKLLLFAVLLLLVAIAGILSLPRKTPATSFIIFGTSYFTTLSFSPDGKRLAVFFKESQKFKSQGRVYDVQSQSKICDLATPPRMVLANVRSNGDEPKMYWPSWSPDGTRIIASYEDGTQGKTKIPPWGKDKGRTYYNSITKIAIWDAQSGRLQSNTLYGPVNEDSLQSLTYFSEDGKQLIGTGIPPAIFDATTATRLRVFRGNCGAGAFGTLNNKLNLVALQKRDYSYIEVFDIKANRAVWNMATTRYVGMHWNNDILNIIDTSKPKSKGPLSKDRMLLWDGKTRKFLPVPTIGNFKQIHGMSWSPDESRLAFFASDASSEDLPSDNSPMKGELIVWDYRRHRVLWRFRVVTYLENINWSPDGKWLSMVTRHTDGQPSHLLAFDKSGKMQLRRESNCDLTDWSADSQSLATIKLMPNVSGRIEILKVAEFSVKRP